MSIDGARSARHAPSPPVRYVSSRYPRLGHPLTAQEQSVLRLMSSGSSTREIALRAGIGVNTVKFHLKNLFEKIGATRRTQAVLLAHQRGLLSIEAPSAVPLDSQGPCPIRDTRSDAMTATEDRTDEFDVSRRYVRVRGQRPDGFIEFDFAIGEPGTFIEMVLRPAAFEEFCTNNQVIHLGADSEPTTSEPSSAAWMPRDAVSRGLGHS